MDSVHYTGGALFHHVYCEDMVIMIVDKVAEMEERINRLEEKLKLTFVEIEKRLNERQSPEVNMDERIQELEDLLLLLQLENTKLKEKVHGGLDFGIVPNSPDISERLNRVETELSHATGSVAGSDVEAKMATLEERINAIHATPVTVPKDVEESVKAALENEMSGEIRELQKKVKTLEALLERRGHEELDRESHLLADVSAILKR